MSSPSFPELFQRLTGTEPFPWQIALYERFIGDEIPSAANLPTGLGKTSVVTIWLIAIITHSKRVPRRLVYVVNRRTVVDQTTAEVVRVLDRLLAEPTLVKKLRVLCAVPTDMPLAISTLRGQFADNRTWCADPARPAVIVGTVDMIGSGLLFSRYTCGFKARPHHAALLGQDVLIVHDEAHLEPAFQTLLTTIASEQERCRDFRPARVLELTATPRGSTSTFELGKADEKNPTIRRRLHATKRLQLHPVADEKAVADKLTALALARRDSGRAVLVFVRSVELAQRVAFELRKQQPHTEVLTGTMRGWERDRLADRNATFLRFLPASSRPQDALTVTDGTAYLVATSAGEVGVNLSADDLVCDLSTYESMAQRFGRVNRFGDLHDTAIDLVHPESFDSDNPVDAARERTLALLKLLKGEASPQALRALDPVARLAAFSPSPNLRPATDILFDAWSLTTIRQPLPGRPAVAPYLHGLPRDWEPPETYVAWREEVAVISKELLPYYEPADLLADFPLKPHELLRDRSSRVRERLGLLAEQPDRAHLPVWLVRDDGSVRVSRLGDFAEKESESLLHDSTVVLPPSAGGLSPVGLLDGKTSPPEGDTLDIADRLVDAAGNPLRVRVRNDEPEIPETHARLRLIRVIDTWRHEDEPETPDEAAISQRYWLWLEAPAAAGAEGTRQPGPSVTLDDHTSAVTAHARSIVQKLALPERLAHCIVLAAQFHDLGKKRRNWQRSIGNFEPDRWLAKAGRELRAREINETYRHEFGSLLDAASHAEFSKLSADERDLVLHIIAAHHGRGRPHFPFDEAFDPESGQAAALTLSTEVPRRFARLQRRYGRWGLAYLESLLRAADYAASAGIAPSQEVAS